MRDAGVIQVKVPRHWPRALKASVTAELVERIRKKDAKEKRLLALADQQARVTIRTQAELEAWVRRVNVETFNVPLGKVQIGHAKYNHLAQVNLKTKTMTVSKYCLNNVPVDALRYLIVHELAHYFESGHGPRFWALVGRHVPDYKRQSQIIKAFHHQAVIAEEAENKGGWEQPAEALSPATLPPNKAKSKHVTRPKHKESRPWAGFFRQLLLWD
jgi:hypothetical protein